MTERFESLLSFDFDLTKRCIDAFCESSNLGCMLCNIDGEVILEKGNCCNSCSVCKKLFDITKRPALCDDSRMYGVVQSERFGGKYIYFCPVGFTCFVSPIMDLEGVAAFITAGPVLMVDPEDFVKYDLIDTFSIDQKREKELFELIKDIPYIPPERVSKLCDLLFMCAGFISKTVCSNKMLTDQISEKIQGDICEQLKIIKNNNPEQTQYPFDTEHSLLSAIVDGDKQKSQKLLNDILGAILFSSGADIEIIKTRIIELVVLLSRASFDGGGDQNQIFGLNSQYISKIFKSENIDELCVSLSVVMNRFMDLTFKFNDVKHIDIIRKSVNYIRTNYSSRITLEEVASYVYLSPSYFSKIFKDEIGCSFSTYLNKIRIEKSKMLLLTDSVKLVDIPGLVGFEDQSYFSKVFKKVTGVTPGKYKESRGKIRLSNDDF